MCQISHHSPTVAGLAHTVVPHYMGREGGTGTSRFHTVPPQASAQVLHPEPHSIASEHPLGSVYDTISSNSIHLCQGGLTDPQLRNLVSTSLDCSQVLGKMEDVPISIPGEILLVG